MKSVLSKPTHDARYVVRITIIIISIPSRNHNARKEKKETTFQKLQIHYSSQKRHPSTRLPPEPIYADWLIGAVSDQPKVTAAAVSEPSVRDYESLIHSPRMITSPAPSLSLSISSTRFGFKCLHFHNCNKVAPASAANVGERRM